MSSPQNTLAGSFTQRLAALRDQTLRVVDALRDLRQVQAQFWNEGSGTDRSNQKSSGLQSPRG